MYKFILRTEIIFMWTFLSASRIFHLLSSFVKKIKKLEELNVLINSFIYIKLIYNDKVYCIYKKHKAEMCRVLFICLCQCYVIKITKFFISYYYKCSYNMHLFL